MTILDDKEGTTLTEGKISKSIILFALPIFFGNLFQQLYNVVDSLVVGNVLGKEALAAVSSSASLIFLIVGFIHGIFMGAGVTISQYFGAKNDEDLTMAVHTTIAFAFLAGIMISLLGVGLSPWLLRLMGTPSDVLPQAITYLRLYFAGSMAIVMYNACMGIFQAVGDSRRPLYYLIIAAVLNVILDILFVVVLDFGVGGVAVATIISQFTSAIIAFTKLTRINSNYKIFIKKIKIHADTLKKLLKIGLPTGVQNSMIAFANVIVQANINQFGAIAMAGNGSYTKIEGFAFMPIISFSVALTTFIGQNLGAKKYERVESGVRFGLISGVAMSQVVGIIIWILAPYLIALFNSDPGVIEQGVMRAKIIAPFYFLLATTHCISGILRGAGKTYVPMIIMLVSWFLIRISYITIMVNIIPDIRVVHWAYPLTWFISSAALIIYYKKSDWMVEFV